MNPVERRLDANKGKAVIGLIKYATIDAIGTAMFGLGLYGKFAVVNNDAFHPLLNDSNVVIGLLVVGGLLMAWGGFNLMAVMKEKARRSK
jgi:hypothetical protein